MASRRTIRGIPDSATLAPAGATTPMTLPTQARIVIVGGGIVGCSTAYHLAQLGHRDVLLLEQGQLTPHTRNAVPVTFQ